MWTDKTNTLTPHQFKILVNKATEMPHTGVYNTSALIDGIYLCRRCGLALFQANDKFASSCGWPSFDDEITNTVMKIDDADGRRVEILCARCEGHLGHIFHGERLTAKNQRYCVNSASLDFVPSTQVRDTDEAIVAGGCFWGVEHLFRVMPGVLLTEVGYCGGKGEYPTYSKVCGGETGHVEAVRVVFDTALVAYKDVIKYFFEIHNPMQCDGQGPDRGSQYLSRIFAHCDLQQQIAESVIRELAAKGLVVATKILPAAVFWPAEDYHQRYYEKNGHEPYCHIYSKRF